MTAIESYYTYICQGKLPATVPVASKDGKFIGIATTAFDVRTPDAVEMAMSADPRQRALAAIYAISDAMDRIHNESETLEPVIR
jgi:hypothetical protein